MAIGQNGLFFLQFIATRKGIWYTTRLFGAWRRLAARYTGGVEVDGSNPSAPTKKDPPIGGSFTFGRTELHHLLEFHGKGHIPIDLDFSCHERADGVNLACG